MKPSKPPQKIFENFVSAEKSHFCEQYHNTGKFVFEFGSKTQLYSKYCNDQERIYTKLLLANFLNDVLTQPKYSRQNFSLIKQLRNILNSTEFWEFGKIRSSFFNPDEKNASRIVLDLNDAFELPKAGTT
jgi:hypothetical protein